MAASFNDKLMLRVATAISDEARAKYHQAVKQNNHGIYFGHKLTDSIPAAAALAVKNGCDLNCGCTYQHLGTAVEQGLITEKEIDVALKRLLTARFKLGMFDPDDKVPYAKIKPEVVA
jgi:beta-glucosidase-like glycosyl hydrolase